MGKGEDWCVGCKEFGYRYMLEVVLVHFLMDIGWYKRKSAFTEELCKVGGPFEGIVIFYYGVRNDGDHSELMVGKCGLCICRGIGRVSGWVLGWLCGCQVGEVIHGNVW